MSSSYSQRKSLLSLVSGKQSARRQVLGCKGDPPGTPIVSSKCRQTGELLWAECGLGLVGGGSPLLSSDRSYLAKGTTCCLRGRYRTGLRSPSSFFICLLVQELLWGPQAEGFIGSWRSCLKEGPKRANSQSILHEVSKFPGRPEFWMILSCLPGLFIKLHYCLGTTEPPVKSGCLDSMTCFSNKLI